MLHGSVLRSILGYVITLCCSLATRGDLMGTETRPASGSAQALLVCLNRLERLAEVLAQHGLRTSLMAPPGRVPSLHVVNPAASALAEDVYAGCGQDGTWWFWWSWAERIATWDDLEGAAALIKRVLAACD
jgi:hypothetical protein